MASLCLYPVLPVLFAMLLVSFSLLPPPFFSVLLVPRLVGLLLLSAPPCTFLLLPPLFEPPHFYGALPEIFGVRQFGKLRTNASLAESPHIFGGKLPALWDRRESLQPL